MDFAHLIFLFLAIGVIAFLYSSVGHAGASGYIAVMTLVGLSTATIRPTALVLNILVALIGSFQFWQIQLRAWPVLLAPDNPFRHWHLFFPPPRSSAARLVRIWEAASFRFAPFRSCSRRFLLSPAPN